jgi:hypothetical protein
MSQIGVPSSPEYFSWHVSSMRAGSHPSTDLDLDAWLLKQLAVLQQLDVLQILATEETRTASCNFALASCKYPTCSERDGLVYIEVVEDTIELDLVPYPSNSSCCKLSHLCVSCIRGANLSAACFCCMLCPVYENAT